MSRTRIAAIAICLFVVAWIAGAMVVGDYVRPLPWGWQALYYPLAGFVWVFPVRWMMLWAVRK
jgi:hypothetical protein